MQRMMKSSVSNMARRQDVVGQSITICLSQAREL
jgi:hypothetical protein